MWFFMLHCGLVITDCIYDIACIVVTGLHCWMRLAKCMFCVAFDTEIVFNWIWNWFHVLMFAIYECLTLNLFVNCHFANNSCTMFAICIMWGNWFFDGTSLPQIFLNPASGCLHVIQLKNLIFDSPLTTGYKISWEQPLTLNLTAKKRADDDILAL